MLNPNLEAIELNNEEYQRYSRHIILPEVGLDGQKRLKAASVLCIGSGGLGSPLLLYLAAAGIGRIGLVDFDIVDSSNLQRQIIHSESWVGKPKIQSAKDRIHSINPHCQVDLYETAISSENALEILEPYDVVVDGTDNFPTRYLTNDACVLLDKPNVYGSIFRFEGQATVFNYQGGPNYRDLYPSHHHQAWFLPARKGEYWGYSVASLVRFRQPRQLRLSWEQKIPLVADSCSTTLGI